MAAAESLKLTKEQKLRRELLLKLKGTENSEDILKS